MTHRKQINKKLPRGNKYCRKVQPYERYWARRHGDARNWGRPMPLLTKSQHLRARKRARAARMWYIQYTIDQIPHILRVHSNREYVDAIEEAELLQHGPIVAGFLARWWRGSYYCGARDAKFRQLGGDENNEKGWAEWKKGFKYRKMVRTLQRRRRERRDKERAKAKKKI